MWCREARLHFLPSLLFFRILLFYPPSDGFPVLFHHTTLLPSKYLLVLHSFSSKFFWYSRWAAIFLNQFRRGFNPFSTSSSTDCCANCCAALLRFRNPWLYSSLILLFTSIEVAVSFRCSQCCDDPTFVTPFLLVSSPMLQSKVGQSVWFFIC